MTETANNLSFGFWLSKQKLKITIMSYADGGIEFSYKQRIFNYDAESLAKFNEWNDSTKAAVLKSIKHKRASH